MSLDATIDLYRKLSLMQNKEGTCIIVLLHEVLPFHHFAEFELFQQHLSQHSILNERRKGEMAFEAFQYDSLIIYSLLLSNFQKVLIYLAIVDGPQCTYFLGFSLTLNNLYFTSSMDF
jgi:hypothetical protein